MRTLTLLAAALIAGPAAAAPPNVVVVMTDDQGLGDFSFTGNPVLKTPNFDEFARESVRLTDFHCAPMCSPTRGQLLTGLAGLRNGATSVTAGRTFVRPGLPMMPELFAKGGYKTGLFGKWHLGDTFPNRPTDRGFQEAAYHLGWGMLQSTPEVGNPLTDGRYFHNGVAEQFKGHCTDAWFDKALAWMGERKAKGEPFLCYIPTNAPHAPCLDLPEYVDPYKGKGPAGFFGMIAHLDRRFGDLDKFLADNGLRDNTVVVFTTDNGGTAGVPTFNAGLRGHKTEYYEGGHRVPCWVRWPAGKLGDPRDIDVPTQNADLLPTLLDLCGLPAPVRPGITADETRLYAGTSLVPLLRGDPAKFPDRTLVVQYGQTPAANDCCVIWKQWRLVKGKELYDVAADRGQKADVAAANPDVVAAMAKAYAEWWKGVEPLVSDFVPIHLGAKEQPTVELTSGDWANIYADNIGFVRAAVGGPTGGVWHVEVDRPGAYEFTLRRWPEQVKTALGAKYDDPAGGPKAAATRAFPGIATAFVEAGGVKGTSPADPKAMGAVVRVTLPAGKTTLKAWFRNGEGKDVCGAFFVTATRAGE